MKHRTSHRYSVNVGSNRSEVPTSKNWQSSELLQNKLHQLWIPRFGFSGVWSTPPFNIIPSSTLPQSPSLQHYQLTPTLALCTPVSTCRLTAHSGNFRTRDEEDSTHGTPIRATVVRSEERRVGKEVRFRWAADH